MIRVKSTARFGKIHYLPGPNAYKALCGVWDTDHSPWMPISGDVPLWGECKRCKAIKDKAQAPKGAEGGDG